MWPMLLHMLHGLQPGALQAVLNEAAGLLERVPHVSSCASSCNTCKDHAWVHIAAMEQGNVSTRAWLPVRKTNPEQGQAGQSRGRYVNT